MFDNDIYELFFIGKVWKKFTPTDSSVLHRKFLVRRKQVLELMYTNGLYHRVEKIQDSWADRGYYISEIIMRNDMKQFVACYAQDHNESIQFFKAFDENYDKQFKLNEKARVDSYKNVSFNDDNKLKQIKIIQVS